MLALARERVEDSGWRNVTLVAAAAEDAAVPATADGALFCGVHDVMRSRPALANVLGTSARAGGWSPVVPSGRPGGSPAARR